MTTGRLLRGLPQRWRVAAATGALLLAIATLLAQHVEQPAAVTVPSLAAAIAPDMLAARLPYAWLAAPPPRLAVGDRVDVLGSRASERSGVVSVVVDARVLEAAADAVVLELAPEDASALAAARANAYLLVLALRPAR